MKRTMIRRVGLLLSVMMLGALELFGAEYASKIDVLKGERWWGVFVVGGRTMPFDKPFPKINLAEWSEGQTTPFLVSSRGRYIWSEEPFTIEYTGESFLITSPLEEVKAVTGGRTLREAYLVCCHKNFPPSGETPSLDLFTRPVYDTRQELGFAPTAEGLRNYADRLLEMGYPTGTMVLGAGWQRSVGWFQPNPDLLGDFGALIGDLHAKGFKVMLTVTPFVSGDGPVARHYKGSELLLHMPDGRLAMAEWAGGYSAMFDLTQEQTPALLRGWLDSLCTQYGVDGYVFDCQDGVSQMCYASSGTQDYLERWTELGEGFAYCQYTISRSRGFEPYIHCLSLNVPLDSDILKNACAEMINANLLGYPYTILLPNMDSLAGLDLQDYTLLLRSVQLSSILPVMHIQVAPWKIQEESIAKALKWMANHRVEMSEYYASMIQESARTAEPILRHMEYEFPRNGFIDCDDQFMLGSKYLIVPLLDKNNTRTVRLPRGIWIDREGKRYRGPLVTTVTSPDGYPLVFHSGK